MGTRGYLAYRYKKKYYLVYISGGANPSGFGVDFVNEIPQDAEEREAWIVQSIEMIENAIAFRTTNRIPDGEECSTFSEISGNTDWSLGSLFIEWTYVFDLENQVFMGLDGEVGSSMVPCEYFTSVSLWPEPSFEVQEAQRQYSGYQPIVVAATEWGASTWDALSVPQHLSAQLVRTLVRDHIRELELVEFPRVHNQIGLFCWRMVTASAPSSMVCTPHDAPRGNDNITYVAVDRSIKKQTPTVDCRMIGHGFLNKYCWFRNCLVTFCITLNEPAFVMHEVNKMISKVRDKERTEGVGLIVSSWQVVAVYVNGSEVRHSPALSIHDNKEELKEGLLLMMHLLGPVLSGAAKTPWSNVASFRSAATSAILPHEILERIVYFTDFDTSTYKIPLVSQTFRAIHLSRPRVGQHTLLAKSPGSGSMFKTQGASCGTTLVMTLARIKPLRSYLRHQEPRRFRLRRITAGALNPGLAGSFQHCHFGQQSGNVPDKVAQKLESKRTQERHPHSRLIELDWRVAAGPTTLPEVRIQVLDGAWSMISDVSELAPEEPPESLRNGPQYELSRWYSQRDDYVDVQYSDSEHSDYNSE